jgi:histidinol dehydrogenase
MLKRLDLRNRPAGTPLELPRPDLDATGPIEAVRAILSEVRLHGDEALRNFTERFDGVRVDELRVPDEALAAALQNCPFALREALVEARDAIAGFHYYQPEPQGIYERGGIMVQELILPVDRAGVYAPGGLAKYPSSVLMTAVPAQVAGVSAVTCCAPPGRNGELPVELLAACALAEVDDVYRVGGAQAIAAMAYGTESVEKVDVIVGPGSKWVSIALREVRGVVGVPGAFAGPSEVVVIADENTPADWAAIDVIVQAEHGPDGLSWFITWSERAADAISTEIERLVAASPRRKATEQALSKGGYAVIVDGPEQALDVSNAIAPEHLEILTDNAQDLLRLVRHAGAVFLGPYSSAAVGDYLAGPSHVLPTYGTARFASVLGVGDFCRRVHAIEVNEAGIGRVARHVAEIANAEGLPAHAESVRLRVGTPTWGAR